tara:strand:+ start:222 stop:422 length:201 start_codon:yes stop_codon:yes gene_type:complete
VVLFREKVDLINGKPIRRSTAGRIALFDFESNRKMKKSRLKISIKGIPNETKPEYLKNSGDTHTLP